MDHLSMAASRKVTGRTRRNGETVCNRGRRMDAFILQRSQFLCVLNLLDLLRFAFEINQPPDLGRMKM